MAEVFGDRPAGSAVQSCPLQAPHKTYWIEIELVGEDGQPIPWEEYLVELPSGVKTPGYLDAAGFARFSGLTESGDCKVCFPKLDRDAWESIAVLPEKSPG